MLLILLVLLLLHQSSPLTSSSQINSKIRSLGRSGQIHAVLDLWHLTKSPDTKLMNLCIDACGRCRPVRRIEAFKIFRDGVGVNLDEYLKLDLG